MRRAPLYSSSLLLAGCLSGEKFVSEYVEAECTYALECYDEAVLNFRGWDSVETCMDVRGPEYAGQIDGCILDKSAGRECLKQLKGLGCPADGEDPTLPAICTAAFPGCDPYGSSAETDSTDTDA